MALQFQNYTFLGDKFATGGLNLKWAATNLEDNESPNAKNVIMTKRGAVSTRNGFVKLNRAQVAGAPICLGIYEHYLSTGTSFVLSGFGTDIWRGVGTLVSIKGGQSAIAYYDFASFLNWCLIVNGANTNWKYDGTNIYQMGITAPAAALANAALVVGAIPPGTYQYVYTYENADGEESNPSPAHTVVIPGGPNQNVPLTGITVSADPQVVARNIYRTSAGGGIFLFVATIADNVTTIYTDSTIDSGLGAEVEFDNDVPPIFRYIDIFKNRVIGVDANENSRIWVGKEFKTGQFPLLNYIDINPDDGDVITGIVSFFDQLVIFKNRSIYVMSGNSEVDFAVQRAQSDSRIGCVAPRSIVSCDNTVLFLSERGVYEFDGLRTNYLSEKIEPVFDRTNENQSLRFNWVHQDIACGTNYKNGSRNWYALAIPTGSSINNRYIWIYDYVQRVWFPFDGIEADSMAIVTESNEPRWYTGRLGFLWRQDDTDSDGWIHNPSYSTSNANALNSLEDLTQAVIHSTATAGGVNTLTDATLAMTVNEHVGKQLYISAGTDAGDVVTITANNATTFTVAPNFAVVPDNTSVYDVGGWPINALRNVRVKIIDGFGKGQIRTITTNTATKFFISVNWDATAIPNTLSKYSVGFIESEWDSRWFHYNAPEWMKRLNYVTVNADREGDYDIQVGMAFDFFTGDVNTEFQSLALTGADSVWDTSLWDVDSWDQVSKSITRLSVPPSHIHRYVQILFRKDAGNQPFTINSFDLLYQVKGMWR